MTQTKITRSHNFQYLEGKNLVEFLIFLILKSMETKFSHIEEVRVRIRVRVKPNPISTYPDPNPTVNSNPNRNQI
jgi:hypothetical protein